MKSTAGFYLQLAIKVQKWHHLSTLVNFLAFTTPAIGEISSVLLSSKMKRP
jgi:hypothetical protein